MWHTYVGLRLRLHALFFQFFSVFLSFPLLDVNTENLCHRLGTTEAKISELGTYTEKELLYSGIEGKAHCSYSSFYLSFSLSFQG